MKKATAILAVLMTASCGEVSSEYSTYPCRFVFNMSQHANSAALRSTVGSTGIFCKVTRTMSNQAQYYSFATNQGLSDKVILNDIDRQTTIQLGMNNAIYIGYGNLDNPPVFYAYDGECPNCFDPNAVPVKSRPLKVSSTGIASCAVCHRQYNMNTGGNITAGDKGKPLTRYHASYVSTTGIVAVTN